MDEVSEVEDSARSSDQLGKVMTLEWVSPASASGLKDIGTTGTELGDRRQMRKMVFDYHGTGKWKYDLAGLNKRCSADADVHRAVRLAAKEVMLESLRQVNNIKTLPALEEFLKIASGFGIIRRTYESTTEQIWAREIVDNSLALYDGSDYHKFFKPADEVEDDPNGMKWKTVMKYARSVFGTMNHFFGIYIMTWLPDMEGIIHSHGESACSFKFLTEARGFASQGFHNIANSGPPSQSVAFQDWRNVSHFGLISEGSPAARLTNMDMVTSDSVGNARRGRVFYIQDDIGVHRFDNANPVPGFTVNVYYPSYEKTWLFSKFQGPTLVHSPTGVLKDLTAVKEWLDENGRDAPVAQMADWREERVKRIDRFKALRGILDRRESEAIGDQARLTRSRQFKSDQRARRARESKRQKWIASSSRNKRNQWVNGRLGKR
jgi:hypothetical protein